MAQLAKARDGRMVAIDDDVGGIAQRIREIDPGLCLRYSEPGECFVVYHVQEVAPGRTRERLVTTSTTCDGRLLQRIERIASDSYDLVAELDRIDAEADRHQAERFADHVGELGKRLAHALRKDLGIRKDRIVVPRGA